MAKWIYLVETNCSDPSRDAEYNDWYDNTHLPDILETPGFVKATRYELTKPVEGKGKYLAIYEIESDTDDLDAALAALRVTAGKAAEQGRMTDLVAPTALNTYKWRSSYPR